MGIIGLTTLQWWPDSLCKIACKWVCIVTNRRWHAHTIWATQNQSYDWRAACAIPMSSSQWELCQTCGRRTPHQSIRCKHAMHSANSSPSNKRYTIRPLFVNNLGIQRLFSKSLRPILERVSESLASTLKMIQQAACYLFSFCTVPMH